MAQPKTRQFQQQQITKTIPSQMNGKNTNSTSCSLFSSSSSIFLIPSSSSSTSSRRKTHLYQYPGFEFLKSKRISRTHLYQIHAQLTTRGHFHAFSRTLLEHASNCGDIDQSLLLFKHIGSLKQFCVNNVIKAYSFSCVPGRAFIFYHDMLTSGFFPNSYTFLWLFSNCAKLGSLELSRKIHAQAVKHGAVDFVLPVQNALIHLYGCCGAMEFGRKVFNEMRERCLVSWNSIIGGYVSVGDLCSAHELFDVMHRRNVVSWNILIGGYLKTNNPGCAMMMFRKMMRNRFQGNDTTMVNVISACSKSARLKEGRSVHGFIIRRFWNLNVVLETSLIDMYSRRGKVELGQRVFDRMIDRNVVCWNAMITGHCIHGNPEDGLKLFSEMVGCVGSGSVEGIHPDEVSFIGVLCACARRVMVSEGREFFGQMVLLYGLKPNFAHHWCMANLYAAAGLLQEAEDVLRIVPEDDLASESSLWINLLILCRFRENATFGEQIAKSLIDKEPWNFSHYRLLMNVYAVAGKWDDVARVKEMVKEKKVGRMPGCYLVDLKEIVHDYKLGHHWRESIGDLRTMLDKMAE